MAQEHLPEIHRPGGARWFQDDLLIYKIFGVKIPRWWLGRPALWPPVVVWGSKELRFNNALFWKNEDVGLLGTKEQYSWPAYGPKPIQERGKWYFAIAFPEIFKICIPLPYFCATLKNGLHFRIGCRYSEGPDERYYLIASVALKKLP